VKLGRNVRRLLGRVTTPSCPGSPGTDRVAKVTRSAKNPAAVRVLPGWPGNPGTKIAIGDSVFYEAGTSALSCGPYFYPVYPDYPDRSREIKGFGCPGNQDANPVYPDKWPPWTDDRAWIACWRDAGPTLAERLPVLLAWLAAAPLPPLPRQLAAVELARIARNYRINVEVGP
jgi:hypothetical protein